MTAPHGATTDDRVTGVVRVLMARDGVTQGSVILGTGIPKRTLARRMHGESGWTVAELTALARYFRVPMSAFLDGPDELFVPVVRPIGPAPAVTQFMDGRDDGSATSGNHTPSREVAGGRQLARTERKPGLARYGTHAAAA